jgi:putative transposase
MIRERTANGQVGIDLGIKSELVLSTGEKLQGPKALRKHKTRLRRLSKAVSRKQLGSKNREKAAKRLAKLHKRIRDIRQDWLHKATTKLCQENQLVVCEDLNVAGMLRNRRLARALSDAILGEVTRQLAYKAPMYGTTFVQIDRWYPSSKTCSGCGSVKESLKLSERTYVCTECGLIEDRDVNAAKNILTVGLTELACGQGSSGHYSDGETTLDEAGTTACALVRTN